MPSSKPLSPLSPPFVPTRAGSENLDIDLVDLASPPPSPPLSGIKSNSLLLTLTFDQQSLKPQPAAIKDTYKSVKSTSDSDTSTASIREEEDKHDKAKKEDSDEEEQLRTPITSSVSTLASPFTPLAASPMRRDGSSSSGSSSGASRGSLSAFATPFKFIERPKELSIVRNGAPPSFFDEKKKRSPVSSTTTSSLSPNSSPFQHSSTSTTKSAPSTSTPNYEQQGDTLPPYPYKSNSPPPDWTLRMEPSDGSITLHPKSKAIKIVSPLEATSSDSQEAGKPSIVKRSKRSYDQSSSSGETSSKAARQPENNLRERRGKSEILSLYSKSIKATSTFDSKSNSIFDGPSASTSNAPDKEKKIPLTFGNYSFSFSFPSSSRPSSNLLDRATKTPLPQTPSTASSSTTKMSRKEKTTPSRDKPDTAGLSPTKVPLPLTPSSPSSSSRLEVLSLPATDSLDSDILRSCAGNGHTAIPHSVGHIPALADGIDEIIQEVDGELKQLFSDKKDAEARFNGGLEEVMARIQEGVKSHICHDPSSSSLAINDSQTTASLEELYRSKFSKLQFGIISLKADVNRLNRAITTAKERVQELEVSHTSKDGELQEAYKQFGHYKAEADVTKAKLKEMLEELRQSALEKLNLNTTANIIALKYSKAKKEIKRLKALTENYEIQLDNHDQMNAKSHTSTNTKESPFVVVLLEGHARMFDPQLLRKEINGGQQLADRLTTAVRATCKRVMPEINVDMIAVQLFLDVYTITQQLKVVGSIKNIGQMHAFLDDFTAESDLSSFCDTMGPDGPFNKIKAHIRMYSQMPACKMILLGTSDGQDYVRFLELLKNKGVDDKFYGIQSTQDLQNDPLSKLGSDRIIPINGFFPLEKEQWKVKYQNCKMSSQVTNAPSIASSRSPSVISKALSNDSGSTARASPIQLRQQQQKQKPKLSDRFTSNQHNLPPPWDRPTLPKEAKAAASDFMSVVDRRVISPMSTNRGNSIIQPSLASRTNKIVVPIDHDQDGYIGNSPPDSDEDDPSVQLPHSAVKRVQRPTTVVEDDSDDDSGLPHGFKVQRNASVTPLPNKPLAPAPWDRNPLPKTYQDIIGRHVSRNERSASSISRANGIPLGSGRRDTIGYETESLSSFKGRRQTKEYM